MSVLGGKLLSLRLVLDAGHLGPDSRVDRLRAMTGH